MNRLSVVSSNLGEVGYDQKSMTLEILFVDGSVYQYFDVPEHVYTELMSADSKGQFLHRNIKGKYRYARI